jgi:hypothetical protein
MKTLRIVALVLFIVLLAFAAQPHRAALAGVTGTLHTLSFPGATATNCGSLRGHGGIIVTPPGVVTLIATDGTGATIRNASDIAAPGHYNGVISSIAVKPTKNPIRVIVFIDGVQIGNLVADNPCLPPSGNGPIFWDPADDRLNREPGQPAALYCRNQGDVHIYAVNVDDSLGKLALIVTKAEIDAVINVNPSTNTLIKQSADGKLKLYYLPATKELSFITHEVRSGKQYSHVWKGLCR